MTRWRALLPVLLAAAVGIAGGLWLQQRQHQQRQLLARTALGARASTAAADDAAHALTAAPLLAATLPDLQGRATALARWRGQPLVVNFWASWCPPCISEMPDLSAYYQQNGGKSFKMIGIAVDEPSSVRALLQRQPVAYPVLLGGATGSTLSRQLGDDVDALPYTVVIDAAGRVVWRHVGRLDVAELAAHLP